MDRRRFLQLGSFGAVAGAFPFVFSEPRLRPGPDGLPGEIAKARARGKPLLVLVIPREDGKKYAKGQELGAWINHGSEAGMADLALVDVVCAGVDEVAELSPEVDRDLEPWMFLVDTRGELPMILPVDPELPEAPADMDSATRWQQSEELGRDRIETFEAALHEAVARGVRLDVWARQCAAVLSRSELDRLDRLAFHTLDRKLIDRGAARLALAARGKSDAVRLEIMTALAATATVRLREVPPTGAKWAKSTGCGTCVEGEEDQGMMVACGMGFVPKLSERFLYFFTS